MNKCWISQETHEYIFRGDKIYDTFITICLTHSELLGLLLFKKHPTYSL